MSELSEERLAELRERVARVRRGQVNFEWTPTVGELALEEAVAEIDRLLARDEWLTVLLGRALVYVDAANMPASWELGDAIRLALNKEASNG